MLVQPVGDGLLECELFRLVPRELSIELKNCGTLLEVGLPVAQVHRRFAWAVTP